MEMAAPISDFVSWTYFEYGNQSHPPLHARWLNLALRQFVYTLKGSDSDYLSWAGEGKKKKKENLGLWLPRKKKKQKGRATFTTASVSK